LDIYPDHSHPPLNLSLEGEGIRKVASPEIPAPSRGGLGRGWGIWREEFPSWLQYNEDFG
jgi:hypothetical protein